jgi:hypothetical protein
MRDRAVLAAVVLSFALLLVLTVSCVFGLAKRAPRWHAALSVLPPFAVYFAYRGGLRVRAVLLGLVSVAYVVLRLVALG